MRKARRLRYPGHIARLEKGNSAFKMLTSKHRGKIILGRPRRKWENNVRIDLKLLSSHDVISRLGVTILQWPGLLVTSCCSSALTQHL